MLNQEFVTAVAGGVVYTGWESMKVTASIKEAVRTFKLETTEQVGQFNFPPGTPIQIYANGSLMVDGYVNVYQPSGDAGDHKVTVSGRGKGQDAVDCAALHDTGEWDDADPAQVADDLARPYDTTIRPKVPLEKVERWALAQGERAFQSLERMLRPQGATLMGNADGSIDITNAAAAKAHYGILMEGQNIKRYSGNLNDGSRHAKYIVKGQRRLGSTASDLRVQEESRDSGGARNRTKLIVNETDTDPKRARARADHEKERAAGHSISCSITTQGFRDFAGELFEPNRLIYVHSPILLHITQTMLIESLDFSQDGKKGSLTDLKLVDPRAYKGQRGGGRPIAGGGGDDQTDAAWTGGY